MTAYVNHVLIASDFANVNGGQAKVAIDSARLLADAGIRVTFFAGVGPPNARLHHPSIDVICLGLTPLGDARNRAAAALVGIWNTSAQRALRKAVENLDPACSVIHCHGWAKALSPSIGPVLAAAAAPTLYTMHEYFLACPNGGFFDYRRGEICTRTPLSFGCCTTNCDVRHVSHKAWRLLRGAVARDLGRLPGGLKDIAYISETQRRAMAPYLPPNARMHAISNPVSSHRPLVDATRNKAFVFVGRLSPEKGAVIFARAALRAGVKAVFVGDGPEAARIVRENPQAEITGWLDEEGVQARIAEARAVIFPSLWYECQPLVPVEALLRGVPVVCGRWNAAAEVVQDGRNGILIDRPTVEDVIDALERVSRLGTFDSSELAEQMSPARHLVRLFEIYNGMLDRKH